MSFVDLAALTIHDVKNRLCLLAMRAEARGDSETLREVLASAGALTRLLTSYKAENGRLRPEINAHSPSELITDLAAEARQFGNTTIITDTGEAPILWFYDETLVRMVLSNAMHNAHRFAQSQVTLSAHDQGEWLEFRVNDDGPGYPDELLANPDTATKLSKDGTGLGLQLSAQVAHLHQNNGQHGAVRLSNHDGACFRLLLPK